VDRIHVDQEEINGTILNMVIYETQNSMKDKETCLPAGRPTASQGLRCSKLFSPFQNVKVKQVKWSRYAP
jgi:hypothetical protein